MASISGGEPLVRVWMETLMKYCSNCGKRIARRIPYGDKFPRYVCDYCQTVHYENPKVIVGCIAEWGGRILLCRRAIKPRYGYWTIPAGFLENGESSVAGAIRESHEETGTAIEVDSLYSVFDIPDVHQVYLIYRGRLLSPQYNPGSESLEVRLFGPTEVPWQQLAYPSIVRILERYIDERGNGGFGIYVGSLGSEENAVWRGKVAGI